MTVLLSVFLTLLVAEFGVRWAVEGGPGVALASFFSAAATNRGAADGLIADERLGYRLDPETPGSNPLAIRDPQEVPPKQAGVLRLLVLGDSISYVIGEGVSYKDGYVNLMRRALEGRVEVLNAATPGYTTYQERLWFELHLQDLEPDVTLLQYCLNDNHRFLHRLDGKTGLLATEEARRVLAPREGDPLWWLPRDSYLAYRARLAWLDITQRSEGRFAWDNNFGFKAAWLDETWPLVRENVQKLDRLVAARGGRLALAIFPIAAQFDPAAQRLDGRYVVKPQSIALQMARELDVPALDLGKAFAVKGGARLFVGDGIHLNVAGHLVAEQAILEFLRERSLIAE